MFYYQIEKLEEQTAISIIKKGNYILLDLRKAKHGRIWKVPDSGIKKGERPKDAVKIETKKEVDININNSI